MDFITVAKAVTPAEAELVKCRLEAYGFFVNLKDADEAISFGAGQTIGPVQVQVPEADAENARNLLETPESPAPEPPSP